MTRGRLFGAVASVLEEVGGQYELDEAEGLAAMLLPTEVGDFQVIVMTDEEAEICVCYALHPGVSDEERRPAVHELVTRLNLGLALGSYDLDLDDGTVRFRSGMDLEGVEDPAPLIMRGMETVVNTVVSCHGAFSAVEGEERLAPVEALQRIGLDEMGQEPDGEDVPSKEPGA